MKLYESEVGVELQFTIKDPNVAVDLTGTTIELLVDGTAAKTCTIVDATEGKCKYVVQSADFATGTRKAQIKITSGSNIYYTDTFTLEIVGVIA